MYINNNNKESLDDIGKIPIEVFITIGQSLVEECVNFEYEINELENKKIKIFEEIEKLSLSNKKLSDKIKENEVNLTKLNKNKFSFFYKSNKEHLYKVLTDDQKLYDETFEQISELYEEIIQITEKIKGLSK